MSQNLASNGLGEWPLEGRAAGLYYIPDTIRRLVAEMVDGFRRYPWGGVETGGLLLGRRLSDSVVIEDYRGAACEHEFGPSFELTDGDRSAMSKLIEGLKGQGKEVVGWYHSVSHRELALTEPDRKLWESHFPDEWQVVLIIKRFKTEPAVGGLYWRDGKTVRHVVMSPLVVVEGGESAAAPAVATEAVAAIVDPVAGGPAPAAMGGVAAGERAVPVRIIEEPVALEAAAAEVEAAVEPVGEALPEATREMRSLVVDAEPVQEDVGVGTAAVAAVSVDSGDAGDPAGGDEARVAEDPAGIAGAPGDAASAEAGAVESAGVAVDGPVVDAGPAGASAVAADQEQEIAAIAEEPVRQSAGVAEEGPVADEPPALEGSDVVAESQEAAAVAEVPADGSTETVVAAGPDVVAEAQEVAAVAEVPVHETAVEAPVAASSDLAEEVAEVVASVEEPADSAAVAESPDAGEEVREAAVIAEAGGRESAGVVVEGPMATGEGPAVRECVVEERAAEILGEPERVKAGAAAAEARVIAMPPKAPVPAPRPRIVQMPAAMPYIVPPPEDEDPGPFALTPDPGYFYPTEQHLEALANIYYGITGKKGFVMITGVSGVGKTMVMECLTDRLRQDRIEYAYVFNAKVTPSELFELLAIDFELDVPNRGKTAVLIALNELLAARSQAGLLTALLIDDAHRLSTEVLEEIELLGNLETRKGKMLQVVMAARPEFEDKLRQEPELRGFRSRFLLRARLQPLTEKETGEYIAFRLTRASQDFSPLLPEPVVPVIYEVTGGLPRMISAVCGRLLERGVVADGDAVREVAAEFGLME